ncbi:hypothetical protein GALMADRAFT_266483 [Galerina marginata CBS 339.88]|uniref:Uncharacterized protein n=1 Tax=Galerina marginata (strain CBS 339.88) TaxID=685588 RepID=A0A067TFZ0_GALM3|nr:hypothetical protein GALMADRAFT_266483 [Galerina marginata CBS 339.88]
MPLKMRDLMAQTYVTTIAPYYQHPLCSEAWVFDRTDRLLLLHFPAISQAEELTVSVDAEVPFNPTFLDHVQFESGWFWQDPGRTISKILEEANYLVPIDTTEFVTYRLMYHLLGLAKCFYYCAHQPDAERRRKTILHPEATGVPFASWFLHSYATKEILVGLRALRHMCLKFDLEWCPPNEFCAGEKEFLKKYDLDPRDLLGFHSWLEGLSCREVREAYAPILESDSVSDDEE